MVEEGEITLEVKEANGASKYDKIMTMIEESEKLKSSLEGKAEHLADRLVPYTFAGTGLVWLLSRNEGAFGSDGRLFLCVKACNAIVGSFCNS